MNLYTLIKKMPKTELHLHLEGAVSADTFTELAIKNNVELPAYEQSSDLYDYDSLVEFLKIYTLVCHSIIKREDFHRVTYECLQRCAESGARYVELFISPESHFKMGVEYSVMLDGVVNGLIDAENDFGTRGFVVPAINRELGAKRALNFVEMVIAHRREQVIGIGLDFNEVGYPPEYFVEAFNLAAINDLHRTSHEGEVGPAENVRNSIDLLKCERVDHGYHVIDDQFLLERCVKEQIVFTICPTTTTYTTKWKDLSVNDHPIKQMSDAGIKMMINSDDPPMLHTSLLNEYLLLVEEMGFELPKIKEFALNGIDGAWLDDSIKRQWHQEWSREIDELLVRFSQ